MLRAALPLLVALASSSAWAAGPVPAAVAPLVQRAAEPEGLRETHARARRAWEIGDADTATDLARDYLREVGRPPPDADPEAWIWLQAAHFGAASTRSHGALPAEPATADLLVDLGWWLARSGDPRGAVDLLEAVLARFPDHADAHLIVAECRLSLGDRDDARRHSQRYLALTTGPDNS